MLHDPIRTDGQALALPPNLGELIEGRNRAVDIWRGLYATYHQQAALSATVCIGGNLGLVAGWRDHGRGAELTSLFVAKDKREEFEAFAAQEIDRRCWANLLEKLGFDQLLDRQAREEFQASLEKEPPQFTEDNVRATFGTIWGNRRDLYLRGIANVFMVMDRRFRSHDAFEIGNRLIIENAVTDGWWSRQERRDALHDVERIFRELDGLGPIPMQHGIEYTKDGQRRPLHPDDVEGIVAKVIQAKAALGTPCVIDNGYFRVRVFGNGNLHLWFQRKDLLAQVNALLLEYYKPVEGDVAEGGPSYETAPDYHRTPARHFGEFFSSEAVAEKVIRHLDVDLRGATVLEPSAGSGVLAKAARAAGAQVACVELQAGLAHELRALHGFTDVRQGDFLRMNPAQLGQFDVILMNPPFDRGRDCDHVRHAFQFLKPGGVLVAVMSARAEFASDARHKALHDLIRQTDERWAWVWRNLPERSFAHAGTNVNTVTLRLQKPRGN